MQLRRKQTECGICHHHAIRPSSILHQVITFAGKQVFLDASIADAGAAALTDILVKLGCTRVDERYTADIFVAKDPAVASVKVRFAACLLGGCLCTEEFLVTGGTAGACITYQKATKVKRFIVVTDAFIALHPVLAKCLWAVLGQEGCAWQMADVDAATAVVQRGADKQRQVLCFVADADTDREDPSLLLLGLPLFPTRSFLWWVVGLSSATILHPLSPFACCVFRGAYRHTFMNSCAHTRVLQDIALFAHKLTAKTCFSDTFFCALDQTMCISGACGV